MHADTAPLPVVTSAMVRQWCEDVWQTQPLRDACKRAKWSGPPASYFAAKPESKLKPRVKKGE